MPAKTTFLSSAIQRFKGHSDTIVVVTGKNAPELTPAIREHGAIVCVNPTPEAGQFSSLKAGLQEALRQGCDAAFIALIDRPPVGESTLSHLQTAFLGAIGNGFWAAVPDFNGRHGHPLLVSGELIQAMLAAPLSSTARDVMHANQDRILYLPVADPTVVANVNTWEEYQRLSATQE